MNMRMATLAVAVSCIFAGCATQGGGGSSAQYGARQLVLTHRLIWIMATS